MKEKLGVIFLQGEYSIKDFEQEFENQTKKYQVFPNAFSIKPVVIFNSSSQELMQKDIEYLKSENIKVVLASEKIMKSESIKAFQSLLEKENIALESIASGLGVVIISDLLDKVALSNEMIIRSKDIMETVKKDLEKKLGYKDDNAENKDILN